MTRIQGAPPPHAGAITIHLLRPEDQPDARALILAGLEEHWGALDPALNPDLNDIMRSYAGGAFMVAKIDGDVVGTGALVPEGDGVARVMRMSVAKAHRRKGIATRVLDALIVEARMRGCHTVVLETTATWVDAIAFYERNGFTLTHCASGDAHFARRLASGVARAPSWPLQDARDAVLYALEGATDRMADA